MLGADVNVAVVNGVGATDTTCEESDSAAKVACTVGTRRHTRTGVHGAEPAKTRCTPAAAAAAHASGDA